MALQRGRTSRPVVLKLECSCESPGSLVETQVVWLLLQNFGSIRSYWVPIICILDKFSSDSDAAGLETPLREQLH